MGSGRGPPHDAGTSASADFYVKQECPVIMPDGSLARGLDPVIHAMPHPEALEVRMDRAARNKSEHDDCTLLFQNRKMVVCAYARTGEKDFLTASVIRWQKSR